MTLSVYKLIDPEPLFEIDFEVPVRLIVPVEELSEPDPLKLRFPLIEKPLKSLIVPVIVKLSNESPEPLMLFPVPFNVVVPPVLCENVPEPLAVMFPATLSEELADPLMPVPLKVMSPMLNVPLPLMLVLAPDNAKLLDPPVNVP